MFSFCLMLSDLLLTETPILFWLLWGLPVKQDSKENEDWAAKRGKKASTKWNFNFIITDIWHTDQNLLPTHLMKAQQKDVSLPVCITIILHDCEAQLVEHVISSQGRCTHRCLTGKAWIKKNKPAASTALLLQLHSTSHANKRCLSTRFIPLEFRIVRWAIARCFGAVVPSIAVPQPCPEPTSPQHLLSPASSSCSVFSWAVAGAWTSGLP